LTAGIFWGIFLKIKEKKMYAEKIKEIHMDILNNELELQALDSYSIIGKQLTEYVLEKLRKNLKYYEELEKGV
jgi:hypothetical protein